MDTLASRLKAARESRKLTQAALAQAAGVSQSTVGNIEAGTRGGLESLAPLAHALQVAYWWLRDGSGEMELSSYPWLFSEALFDAISGKSPIDRLPYENALRAFVNLPAITAAELTSELQKRGLGKVVGIYT